ncbi:hypothetical protein HRbin04_00607 [archaeon HR04]|nr:hypothetical protein HRbin04_00607 [archaeon HR04]
MKVRRRLSLLILCITSMTILISSIHNSSGNVVPSATEQIIVSTNGKFFAQGDMIELKLSVINTTGQVLTINTFKKEYASIVSPCGIGYFDFAFLRGSYPNIATYEDLLSLKDKLINVRWPNPYTSTCMFGYVEGIAYVEIPPNGPDARITYIDRNGETFTRSRHLTDEFRINKYYDQFDTREEISPDEVRVYRASHLLEPGEYTIVGFTLAGTVSKPVVITVGTSTTSLSVLDIYTIPIISILITGIGIPLYMIKRGGRLH